MKMVKNRRTIKMSFNDQCFPYKYFLFFRMVLPLNSGNPLRMILNDSPAVCALTHYWFRYFC